MEDEDTQPIETTAATEPVGLPAILLDDGTVLTHVAQSTERFRYLTKHYDMTGEWQRLLDTVRAGNVYLTPADVTREAFEWLSSYFCTKNCGPAREPLKKHWRSDV